MREGWKHTELGEHIDLLTGHPFKSAEYTERDDAIRLLRGDNVVQGSIRWENARRWPADQTSGLERYNLAEGDIVVALDRTWVKSGVKAAIITPTDLPSMLVQRVARIRAKPTLAQRFLAAIIQSHRFVEMVKSAKTETAVPHISPKDIREFVIDLPPLPEQRKIAAILRTWDEALEKLNALRAAKKKVRDATLQTILNNPDWPERLVGELGTVSSAGVDKKSVEGEMPVRLLNFMDVLRRDFLYDAEFTHEVTAQERKASTCDVRMGDVFFTPSSETRDDIAHSAVAMETMPGVVYSYHVVRLRPTVTLDLCFRAYLFKSHHFLRQAYALAAGSGQRYVLSQDQFREMTVRLPDHATQAKVSAYFTTADREIALLDAEIKALTDQKRGLMQKLLTGEWPVEVSDDEEAAA